ncbi:DNA-methyltransferase [Vibrio mediterranei]
MKLIHGDCIEEMKKLPDNSIDMVLTDPPYGTTQCKWDSIVPLPEMWEQLQRITKPNAAIILSSAQPFTSLLVVSNLKLFKYEIIWEKGNATGFLNAKKMPLKAHENVMVFYNKPPTYEPQFTYGHERKTAKRKTVSSECYGKAQKLTEYNSTKRYPRSVQFFSSDKQKENYHPTQKPVALMEWLIKSYSGQGDVVLDFTMGSGTTGVAAKNLNREFIGIELDDKYFEVASNRLARSEAA